MELPRGCPRPIVTAVEACWAKKPERRPTFKALAEMFRRLRETAATVLPTSRDIGRTINIIAAADA